MENKFLSIYIGVLSYSKASYGLTVFIAYNEFDLNGKLNIIIINEYVVQ